MSSYGSSVSFSSSNGDTVLEHPSKSHISTLGRVTSESGRNPASGSSGITQNHVGMITSRGDPSSTRSPNLERLPRLEPSSLNERIPTLTRNLSDRPRSKQQTWSEFLSQDSEVTGESDLTNNLSQMNAPATDRKRRLTGSTHDSGRRRTVSGGFHNRHHSERSLQLDGPSSPRTQAWPRRTESMDYSQTNFLDLTRSPLPPPPPPQRQRLHRPAVTSTRQYVLPSWQPDSEAVDCPICKRQFTFMFRRHHCRKCGRVVCNECSPHRITIPRQFIVHPPGLNPPTPARTSSLPPPIETIDLTEDSTPSSSLPTFSPPATASPGFSFSNPTLDGGEKVRLCNPCVPDPQPSPRPEYNQSTPSDLRNNHWNITLLHAHETPSPPPPSGAPSTTAHRSDLLLSDHARELRRQRGHGMIVSLIVFGSGSIA